VTSPPVRTAPGAPHASYRSSCFRRRPSLPIDSSLSGLWAGGLRAGGDFRPTRASFERRHRHVASQTTPFIGRVPTVESPPVASGGEAPCRGPHLSPQACPRQLLLDVQHAGERRGRPAGPDRGAPGTPRRYGRGRLLKGLSYSSGSTPGTGPAPAATHGERCFERIAGTRRSTSSALSAAVLRAEPPVGPLLLRQRDEGPDERRRHVLLATLRRLHDHLTATSAGRPASRPRASLSARTSTTPPGTSRTRGSSCSGARTRPRRTCTRWSSFSRPWTGAHQVVVVDPRRTEDGGAGRRCTSGRGPAPTPALALAVAHRLVERGWIDEPFVRDHVHGFEAFRESLRDKTPGLGRRRSRECRRPRSSGWPRCWAP